MLHRFDLRRIVTVLASLSAAGRHGPIALLEMAESEELLTVAEIAAELKMNQQTIRNWI